MPRKKFITAAPFLPAELTIPKLRSAAANCRGCDLWKRATQTVFGQGAAPASVMLVGEQPGDKEDLAGHPFVGPAGKLLDEALIIAGIDKSDVYITNAVKHFNWAPDPRGKSQKAALLGNSSLQAVARGRNFCDPSADHYLPRSDRCPGALGKRIQCDAPARKIRPFSVRAARHGHGSSVLNSARPGRRVSPRTEASLYSGPRPRSWGASGAGASRVSQLISGPTVFPPPPLLPTADTASSARGIVCNFYEPLRQISQA